MLKKAILGFALAFMLIVVSSCGDNKNNGQTYSDTDATPTPATVSESPVTPEPGPTPAETPKPTVDDGFIMPNSDIRPVAVMIDNQGDKVLPQGGISQAQIVYEILTEYNITRYLAFFWDTMPDMIGPVRSSRHYFLDFSMEYDAIYTHFGWSEFAKADISKLKINNINGLVNGDAFRDITKDPGNWQDSYTSKDQITKAISGLGYATKPVKAFPFKYNETMVIPVDGQTAEDIFIKFSTSGNSTCGFLYDKENGLYKRIRMGQPQIERNTGEQVLARNIIIQEMAAVKIEGDQYGSINLKDIGSGGGWFITGGKAVKIKWSKSKRDARTSYTTESGDPVNLNRGQTWIEVVPTLTLVKIE